MKKKSLLFIAAGIMMTAAIPVYGSEGFAAEEGQEAVFENAFVQESFSEKELSDPEAVPGEDPENLLGEAQVVTDGVWEYTIDTGIATVHSYQGSSPYVTIPSLLNYDGSTYRVKKIEQYAFEGNTVMESVVIPESITNLGQGAFKDCANLSYLRVNGNLVDCDSGSTVWSNVGAFWNAGSNADSFEVVFGEDVIRVPAYIFGTTSSKGDDLYAHVTSVVLPESMTEIGRKAFYNCYDLNSIQWGKNIKTIEEEAFVNNQSLRSLDLPRRTETVEQYAFAGCTGLEKIGLPESMEYMRQGAFKDCVNLSYLTVNGNLVDCDSGSTVWSNVGAFWNAGSNADSFEVVFGEDVTRVPAYIFGTTSSKEDDLYAHVTSVVLPESMTEIGRKAFYNCYDLNSIQWGKNIKTIEEEAFVNNQSLRSLDLPRRTETVEQYAFAGCTGLEKIGLPESMEYMRQGAFKDCVNLSYLTVNGNLVDCDSGSTVWSNVGAFWNAGSNADSFEVVFGEDVTRVPAYIFGTTSSKEENQYAHVTSVTIPSGVQSIGRDAFYNCHDLTEAEILSKKALPEENSFGNCSPSLRISCYSSSPAEEYAKNSGYKVKLLDLPKVTVSSAVNTAKGIRVSWKKVSGADGYYVYRKVFGGKYSRIKKIEDGSVLNWTDTAINSKNGTVYYYTVRAYNEKGMSGSYSSKKAVRLTRRAITGLTNPSGRKIYVKWAGNSKSSGYQVQYTTSSGFASGNKTVTVSGKGNTSKTITGLTKGRYYYVRVRSYKTIGGIRYYSAWSDSRKIKIMK